MLAGLRLDGFVGRHHQEYKIDSTDAGEHVAYKTLVAGDVNKTQPQLFAGRSGECQVGKSQVNGDASALFFFETVGVNSSQRLNQGGLAMINVAGGADDDRFHSVS